MDRFTLTLELLQKSYMAVTMGSKTYSICARRKLRHHTQNPTALSTLARSERSFALTPP